MVRPAVTDATIAGADVVMGVSSGSGIVAMTGAITMSRGGSL